MTIFETWIALEDLLTKNPNLTYSIQGPKNYGHLVIIFKCDKHGMISAEYQGRSKSLNQAIQEAMDKFTTALAATDGNINEE